MRYYSWAKHMVPKHKPVISFSLPLLLFVLMVLSIKVIATDTLTQLEQISVGQTLVSSGQVFELGFFSPGNSSRQYVGIWYKNIYAHKIVWVANRDNPLTSSDNASSLIIGNDGNLIILDLTNNNCVWSTNVQPVSHLNSTIAVLSDKGNLILKDNVTGLTLWDSFHHPGDTSIPGMVLGTNYLNDKNHHLSSWKTEDDPSQGVFLCDFITKTPPEIVVSKSSKTYWRSGPWDGSKFVGVPNTRVGYMNGLIVAKDNQGSAYITYNPPFSSYVAITHLPPDGNLMEENWDLLTRQGGLTWQSMHVPCEVYGTCGPYGVCDRNGTGSCVCLKGFVPKSKEEWAKGNWTSGCVRRTELLCRNKTNTFITTRKEKKDGFLKFRSMKLPDNFKYFFNFSSSDCKHWCLSTCFCEAYAYPDGIGCMVWEGDLVDTQQFSFGAADLFLRLAYSELGKRKNHTKILISLALIPGVILLGVFLYVQKRRQGKEIDPDITLLLLGQQTESPDLPMLDFNTLVVATNNFSELNKLGAGGFGPVYKGKLEDGKDIAVKRLSSHSGQGSEEFKNEILMISKLQHRNLVSLLGYCIKGDEKLLIYEYVKNKSLDTWLFEEKRAEQLDWAKRLNIIHGIARGLLYLHRDSRLRIIHRDLKASNILLDDNLNPKISDFGTARAFQITKELANTNRVVGTFGYMSPEYAMGGLFSEKSDVYSFGVLLLEIISGVRITSLYDDGKYNLLCHAWHLWEEGKAIELMDQTLFSSCAYADFIQCMHIGLLCVQDHIIDRPTMSIVVLMLTSDMELPQPKQPLFYKSMQISGLRSQSSRKFYVTHVDDIVNAATLLPPLPCHTHMHDSRHLTTRHTASQSSQNNDLHSTSNQEMKIKSF